MRKYSVLLILVLLFPPGELFTQDLPESLPRIHFKSTSRPWKPLNISGKEYLKAIEDICRVAAKFQNENGAIIDPFLNREHQYSTPYYAFAVGVLLTAGRGADLQESGIMAMEHATESFSRGSSGIPDAHGEFFIAPLSKALELFKNFVPPSTYLRWKQRMKTPLPQVLRDLTGRINNWRTYAMKGEWLRSKLGLVPKEEAVSFIEDAWHFKTQRERILLDKWNLYQDWSSAPQSHAVEAVGRGNLTGLVAEDYAGPSADEIRRAVRRGARTALLLQSPDGQCPPNGRTDDHVFNDVLYQLIFEVMAEDAARQNNPELAGGFRHAALSAFHGILRWQRPDEPWAGSFCITKNYFNPAERIGYQPASQWGNYSGALMMHLAEAFLAQTSQIRELPSPAEIGGYAFSTDQRFSTFVANAGGMQIFVNLRGASIPKYGIYWTPLGVVRITRINWDGRLGPSDGIYHPAAGTDISFNRGSGETSDNLKAGAGITFGPTWREGGKWVRIADVHRHYRITPTVKFVHPLIVKFDLTYHYITGRGGPYFRQEFIVTPDGIFSKLFCLQPHQFGLTIPLLQNDGRALQVEYSGNIATTRYSAGQDEQNFIALNKNGIFHPGGDSLQSTYGWLKPVRYRANADTSFLFIYPRNEDEPPAESVRQSFRIEKDGFASVLGIVKGNLYAGRFSAGGEGKGIDLNDDGLLDLEFDRSCKFVLTLKENIVVSAESDRPVRMNYRQTEYQLNAYQPVKIR